MNDPTPTDDHTARILAAALHLAETDGYDAVRMRDVARHAEVALGTLYRRFRGKEDLLAAVLARMVATLRDAIVHGGLPGDTPEQRLATLLEMSTGALADKPKLAAGLLRTVASGEPALAARVMQFREAMEEIFVVVARGEATDTPPTARELLVARMLLNTWFAELVGWTGGLQTVDQAIVHVKQALSAVLHSLPEVD